MGNKQEVIRVLTVIPEMGEPIAEDRWDIGIRSVADLVRREPRELYE